MFSNFTEEARALIVLAKKEMQELKHPYVGSEHLLLALTKGDTDISKKLKNYGVEYSKIKSEIIKVIGIGSKNSEWFLYTPLLKRIMENAVIDSKENNNSDVTSERLLLSLLEEGEGVAIRILLGMNINVEELYHDLNSKNSIVFKRKKNKKLLLEELGIDLTKKALNGELDPVIGRDNEVNRILEILCRRTKNNPLLVGEAGVGKTALVEELSRRIASGNVPIALKNKRIISLDMATTVAGTKYRGEFEERVKKILKEIEENSDIILFIDEIHTLVGAGGAEGAIDASNIFKPALARNKLRCIGATTTREYKKYIEEDAALERRFQKVLIEEPNSETVKDILLKLKPIYEKYHLVSISDKVIETIIKLSNKYIYDRNEPDKSIDILDEVCARVSLKESNDLKKYNELNRRVTELIKQKNDSIINGDFISATSIKTEENILMNKINNLEMSIYNKNLKQEVTIEDLGLVIHDKTGIPVYEILNEKNKIIKKIESDLKELVIGQDSAVNELVNISKKIKLGLKDDNKCYSMMFCGSSGIGKTLLARKFGEALVGKNNVIKLDMSEYSESHSISKFIGSPPGYVGYNDSKNILESIRNKPYSVLILDEIEKANASIINLLFQILDDSQVKDSLGKTIRFDNVIIIMTSNIGFMENNIGFNKVNNSVVFNKLKENFSVPFINRLDNIILFNSLNEDNIRIIINNKLKILKEKYKSKSISVSIKSIVIDKIIELSNYQEFGARKIDKIIKNKIDNYIVNKILNGNKKVIVSDLYEYDNVF